MLQKFTILVIGFEPPLRPPGEILSPRSPQTIISVLGHPLIVIPGLGTIPDTLGALVRAGELKKVEKHDFRAKSLIWGGFGVI